MSRRRPLRSYNRPLNRFEYTSGYHMHPLHRKLLPWIKFTVAICKFCLKLAVLPLIAIYVAFTLAALIGRGR